MGMLEVSALALFVIGGLLYILNLRDKKKIAEVEAEIAKNAKVVEKERQNVVDLKNRAKETRRAYEKIKKRYNKSNNDKPNGPA